MPKRSCSPSGPQAVLKRSCPEAVLAVFGTEKLIKPWNFNTNAQAVLLPKRSPSGP